jgi:hypothetical protein
MVEAEKAASSFTYALVQTVTGSEGMFSAIESRGLVSTTKYLVLLVWSTLTLS